MVFLDKFIGEGDEGGIRTGEGDPDDDEEEEEGRGRDMVAVGTRGEPD